ncbi:MAG: gamma-glutamylcyclotransferase, partial [Lachnospiraceae bacterium]|nr:gamma-glutamylcyclotransferase [Lachnospiraceae bacterium]
RMTGAYLTDEQKNGGSVPVAAWEVTSEDELALDRYEGYPRFYYKAELTLPIKGIRTGKVRNRNCFVYVMHEDRAIGIPTKSYLHTCLEGYHNFGFDEDGLMQAYANARQEAIVWVKNRNAQ